MARSISGKEFISPNSGKKRTRQGNGTHSKPKNDKKRYRGQGRK